MCVTLIYVSPGKGIKAVAQAYIVDGVEGRGKQLRVSIKVQRLLEEEAKITRKLDAILLEDKNRQTQSAGSSICVPVRAQYQQRHSQMP